MDNKNQSKKNIIITGGAFSNTGAQAMSIIVINEMMIKYPNYNYVMMVDKQNYLNTNKRNFKFEIAEFNIGNMKFFHKMELKPSIRKIFENAVLMIDISGYAFYSQCGYEGSLKYLLKLKLAHNYNIKTYLMPQSFGPFDYNGKLEKIKIYLLSIICFRYPELIYARERQGYKLMKNLCGKNLKLANDLVLSYNRDIILENIFDKNIKLNYIKLNTDQNVAIIPNTRLITHGSKEKSEIVKIYQKIICKLLQYGKHVYIIAHSKEDMGLCKILKNEFIDEDNVVYIKEELNFLEFEFLISQFDYAVAARYHSIVHAYKKGVPCLALGWATKYRELLELFSQSKYFFDIRSKRDINSYYNSLDVMNERYANEKMKILHYLEKTVKTNIFDSITV